MDHQQVNGSTDNHGLSMAVLIGSVIKRLNSAFFVLQLHWK